MFDIMKVKSTFLFMGKTYRVYFSEQKGEVAPIIEQKKFSFLGFSIWTDVDVIHEPINEKTKTSLITDKTLGCVKYLRAFAVRHFNESII